MDSTQVAELLVRVDERTLSIEKKVDSLIEKANNGGWARCATNNQRINVLEKDKDNRLWKDRMLYTTFVGVVLTTLWQIFMGL